MGDCTGLRFLEGGGDVFRSTGRLGKGRCLDVMELRC